MYIWLAVNDDKNVKTQIHSSDPNSRTNEQKRKAPHSDWPVRGTKRYFNNHIKAVFLKNWKHVHEVLRYRRLTN
jgi:hypothetical protein